MRVRYHGGTCEVGVPMAFLRLGNSVSSLFYHHSSYIFWSLRLLDRGRCPSERIAVVKLPGWLECGEVREVEMGKATMAAGRAERARRDHRLRRCEWSERLTAYRAADRSRYAIE